MNQPPLKNIDNKSLKGWVLYDGECSFCSGWINRYKNILKKRGFEPIPLHTKWVKLRLNLSDIQFTEMYVLTSDDQLIAGGDAVIFLTGKIWWLWGLYALAKIPGMISIFRCLYRIIARNRHCRFLNTKAN